MTSLSQSSIVLSDEQQAIIDFVRTKTGNLLAEANPGVGKTFMISQIVKDILKREPNAQILCLAFTNEAVNQIVGKIGERENVVITTTHKLGNSLLFADPNAVWKYNPYLQGDNSNNKFVNIIKYRLGFYDKKKKKSKQEFAALWKDFDIVVALCDAIRLTLCPIDHTQIATLADFYGIECTNYHIQEAIFCLRQGELDYFNGKTSDTQDMLYLPVQLGMNPETMPGLQIKVAYGESEVKGKKSPGRFYAYRKFDYILLDECQDFNKAQLRLIKLFTQPYTRLFFFGQKEQSIMGFAYADPMSIDNIKAEFQTVSFGLTYTRRCAKEIVRYTNGLFPDIPLQAYPDNPEGSVSNISFDEMIEILKPGDCVLARANRGSSTDQKKLYPVFLDLISRGLSVYCHGYNPVKDIIQEFNKIKAEFEIKEFDWSQIESTVFQYRQLMSTRLKPYEIEVFYSNIDALIAFIKWSNASSEKEFLDKIKYANFAKTDSIILMSCHSSKGTEHLRVFLLNADKFPYRYKGAKDWQNEQEDYLLFVALTRAQLELYNVN